MPRTRPITRPPGGATPWLLAMLMGVIAWTHDNTSLARPLQHWLQDRAVADARPIALTGVATVLIDEASQGRHGPLPWRRDLHARLIDQLSGARVIIDTEPFGTPESERALAELQNIQATIAADPLLARHPELPALIERSEASLNGDAHLTQSLEHHGRVLLSLGTPGDGIPPLPRLAEAAAGIGHAVLGADEDGVIRSHPLWRHGSTQDALSLAALAAGLQHGDSPSVTEAGLRDHPARMSSHALSEGDNTSMIPLWPVHDGPNGAPPSISAHEVLAGSPGVARLQGRIVVIGRDDRATARLRLPDHREVSSTEALARLAGALTDGHWVSTPPALHWLPWGLLLAAWLYLWRLVPRLTQNSALMLTASLCLALALSSHGMLVWSGLWVTPTLPVMALIGGHLALIARDRWNAHRRRRHAPLLSTEARDEDTVITSFETVTVTTRERTVIRHDDAPSSASLMPDLQDSDPPGSPPPATKKPRPRSAPPSSLPENEPAPSAPDSAFFQATQPLRRTPAEAQAPRHLLDTQVLLNDHAFSQTQVLRPPEALEATQPLSREELAACLSATTANRLPPTLSDTVRRQQTLGPYVLEREVGRGAMGRVHLAHHLETGAQVAIKTLALAKEFDGYALYEARQRFEREAQAAGRLDHPDIVRVIEFGEQEGVAYIAMERLGGHTLEPHLGPDSLLPVATVVTISRRIARALAHAHAQGIIHRDIKPANIMVDIGRNQVKVTDFGIARITDANRTRTGLVLGTPSYMSPEQLAGRTVDGRSDLYSLGVLMFQMLTGELPLSGHTMSELIGAIARQPAPDIRTRRPGLPAALAEVVGILLEKRPELRYRDGLDLAEDLRLVADALRRPERATSTSRQECATGAFLNQPLPLPGHPDGAQSRR